MSEYEQLAQALRDERRQPVQLNLGQVSYSPVIGRLGNYSVIVGGYQKSNTALELSTALSQVPTLLQQGRNLQEKMGIEKANQMDIEDIIQQAKDGDQKAGIFLGQLGGNKAYEEQVYRRLYENVIKPGFIRASTEFANLSPEQLVGLDEDSIKAKAQQMLVESIDPKLLEGVGNSLFQAPMHNRTMEAAIPEFVEKSWASASAKQKEYGKKLALNNISSNMLSGLDVQLTPYVAPEGSDFTEEQLRQKREEHDVAQRAAYTKNFQDTITSVLKLASEQGLDKFEAEAQAISALQVKMAKLIEDEDFVEANAVLTAMEDGTIKVNNRPLKHTQQGLAAMTLIETKLEQAEEDDETDKIDTDTVDEYDLQTASLMRSFIRTDATEDDFVKLTVEFDEIAAKVESNQDYTPATKLRIYDRLRQRLDEAKTRKAGFVTSTYTYQLNKKRAADIEGKYNLGYDSLKTTYVDIANTLKIAEANGWEKELNKLITPSTDIMDETPITDAVLNQIIPNALKFAIEKVVSPMVHMSDEDLYLKPKTPEEAVQAADALKQASAEKLEQVRVLFEQNVKEAVLAEVERREKQGNKPIVTAAQQMQDLSNKTGIAVESLEQSLLKQQTEAGENRYALDPDSRKIKYEQVYDPDAYDSDAANRASYSLGPSYGRIPAMKPYIEPSRVMNTFRNEQTKEFLKTNNNSEEILKMLQLAQKVYRSEESITMRGRTLERGKGNIQFLTQKQAQHRSDSKYMGIPMEALRNGGVETLNFISKKNLIFPDVKGSEVILHNTGGALTDPEAPSTRLYNLQALIKARAGDTTDLEYIQKTYQPNMPYDEFYQKQNDFMIDLGVFEAAQPE